uniref:Uncharacterized protein n=1 Tax=Oryza barthii TaxID=65489 RepID=A0A0D3HDT2_9ORYZ
METYQPGRRLAADHHRRGILAAGSTSCYPYAANPYRMAPAASLLRHVGAGGGAMNTAFTETTTNGGGDASYSIGPSLSLRQHHTGVGGAGDRTTVFAGGDALAANYPYSYATPVPYSAQGWHRIGAGGGQNTALPNFDHTFGVLAPYFAAADLHHIGGGDEQNIEKFYYNSVGGEQKTVSPNMGTLTTNAFSFATPAHYLATEFYYNGVGGEQNIEEFYYNGVGGEQNIEEFYYNGASGEQNMAFPTTDTHAVNIFSFATPAHYSVEEFHQISAGGEQNMVSPNTDNLAMNAFSFAAPFNHSAAEFLHHIGASGERNTVCPNNDTPLTANAFSFVAPVHYSNANADLHLHVVDAGDEQDTVAANKSIAFLSRQGHDLREHRRRGVSPRRVYEGLLRHLPFGDGRSVTWLAYHGDYDLGFLLRLLQRGGRRRGGGDLPCRLATFLRRLRENFPAFYDVRVIRQLLEDHGFSGKLTGLAEHLGIRRTGGAAHHAGPDALLTLSYPSQDSSCISWMLGEGYSLG